MHLSISFKDNKSFSSASLVRSPASFFCFLQPAMRVLSLVSLLGVLCLQTATVDAGNLRGVQTRSVNCPSLDSIYQGSVSYSGTSPGSTASYSCMKGAVLSGSSTRSCSSSGVWTPSQPSCRVQYLRKNDNSYKNADKGYQLYSG